MSHLTKYFFNLTAIMLQFLNVFLFRCIEIERAKRHFLTFRSLLLVSLSFCYILYHTYYEKEFLKCTLHHCILTQGTKLWYASCGKKK